MVDCNEDEWPIQQPMAKESTFTLVQGGRDENERLFQELIEAPHAFTLEEFDARVERFRERLPYEAIEALFLRRIEKRRFKDELERRILLAILRGERQEYERLCAIHRQRERLGLKVLGGKRETKDSP